MPNETKLNLLKNVIISICDTVPFTNNRAINYQNLCLILGILLAFLPKALPGQDPIFDYIDISNTTEFIGCTAKTMVLKESFQEQYIYWPDSANNIPYYQKNRTYIFDTLYNYIADIYDFLIISLQATPLRGSFSGFTNFDIQGIGFDFEANNEFIKNLKNNISMDNYWLYDVSKPYSTSPVHTMEILIPSRSHTSVHEIAHHWCCGLHGFFADTSKPIGSHWASFIDLFSADTSSVDHMTGYHWANINDEWRCIHRNDVNVVQKFSNLTMYLMGLIPPSGVDTIFIHQYDTIPGNSINYTNGPNCQDSVNFTGTRKITIDSIIAYNGERIPTWQESQKDFRLGNVIVVPYGETLDLNFVRFVNEIKAAVPNEWTTSTDSLSTVFYDCPDTNWAGTTEPPEFRSQSPITVFTSGQKIQLGINIESTGAVEIEMFSFAGKKIISNLRQELSQGYSLVDVKEFFGGYLERGGYLIRVKIGDGWYIKKFVLI